MVVIQIPQQGLARNDQGMPASLDQIIDLPGPGSVGPDPDFQEAGAAIDGNGLGMDGHKFLFHVEQGQPQFQGAVQGQDVRHVVEI